MLFIFILIALLSLPMGLSAQKMQTASGSYTYHVPSNIPIEQAEIIAFNRLKTQLIAEKFGTLVSSSNFTSISHSDNKSSIKFLTFGENEVKGEWIETIGSPKYTYNIDEQGGVILTISATGKIRELKYPPIEFKSKLLRNATEDVFESYEFKEDDKLYMSFQSPIAGYLSVYLFDGNAEVYRMLPYSNQADKSLLIEANKRYVFFSLKEVGGGISEDLIDEYILSCSKRVEYNRVYIVFSPTKYITPIDYSKNADFPKMLSFEEFQKWLTKHRKLDPRMSVEIKDISINKK